MKTVTLSLPNHGNLTRLADAILDTFETKLERLDRYELIVGAGTIHGSGNKPVLKIIIQFDTLDQEALDTAEAILALAKERASDLQVRVDETEAPQ